VREKNVSEKTSSEKNGTELGFRPLYLQVRERLTQRIASGQWRAGDMVPSEIQIAADLGVSQGTVRKALDEMTSANLLVRRQGRGTFVTTHDETRILFQFFKLKLDTGARLFPESEVLGVTVAPASPEEADKLSLSAATPVIRIRRTRSLAGRRMIVETVVLPASLYVGIARGDIPNNLYDTFARSYGVTVSGGEESLKAVTASAEDAGVLGLEPGAPLLLIDRVATDLDGRPVEWRVSRCDTSAIHYATSLK
jgi:GntR family transcriptional regulator